MLYKDHSGRILENGDTLLEAQGSGNSNLASSPVSILPKTNKVGKRPDSHFLYSEEELEVEKYGWKKSGLFPVANGRDPIPMDGSQKRLSLFMYLKCAGIIQPWAKHHPKAQTVSSGI